MATLPTAPSRMFTRNDWLLLGGSAVVTAAAGLTHGATGGPLVPFLCAAVAMALLASVVGHSVEQLGDRFGPGATGVLQSALGNLPELFIAIFALKAGMVGVVQAALIGSILANLLLVLGLAFIVGGLKHGTQKLDSERARAITMMMVLSVVALVLPSVASYAHAPASRHEGTLSVVVSIVLLAIFVLSLPASLRKGATDLSSDEGGCHGDPPRWSALVAVGVLAMASIAAAFVSDWFVQALEPSMKALGINEIFAGLVIVAIAGNAIENVVGVQLAAKNQSRYAFSVIVNSPLQIALVLAPALVLLSHALGFAPLDLVFSPMLVASVALAVIVTAFVTFDGESNWLEGAGLVAVYAIIATCFWWG